MKIDRKGLLAVLFVLCQFSICAGADPALISGFYYQDEISNPLPGALIALYKADDNTLVDYTYTRNDGKFALKGPAAKGKYYVVATKDHFSQKVDFDYDPQAQPLNLMIQHHQPESRLSKLLGYVWERFDDVIKLLIGFLAGLVFKWYEDRKKARQTILREIKGIEDSSADILKNYERLQQVATDYGKSKGTDADEKRQEFIGVVTKIGTQAEELLKELNENSDLEEAIYTAQKLSGRNQYATLRKVVREIKQLTDTIIANRAKILDDSPADREAQLKPFVALRESSLLKQLNK